MEPTHAGHLHHPEKRSTIHNPRAFLVCHGFLLAPAPAGLIPPRLQQPEQRSATDGAEMTALCATRVKNAGELGNYI